MARGRLLPSRTIGQTGHTRAGKMFLLWSVSGLRCALWAAGSKHEVDEVDKTIHTDPKRNHTLVIFDYTTLLPPIRIRLVHLIYKAG